MESLIVKNIKKSYKDINVLNDISFSLNSGNIISIIGPSGEGKSTLLRCITSLEKVDSGTIIINNKPLVNNGNYCNKETEKEILKDVGIIFQDFNLFPHLTVIDNVSLALRKVYKYSKLDATNKSLELLSKFNLLERKNSYPSMLSGGEKQRVAIARTLITDPKLICFDEPTSALDPKTIGGFKKIVMDLKNNDKAILIVTHDIKFALEISDFIIFQKNGIINAMGTKDELLKSNSKELNEFINEEKDNEEC